MSKTISNVLKTALIGLVLIATAFTFVACGNSTKTLWSANFDNGNDSVFVDGNGGWGQIVENTTEKTITLKPSAPDTYGLTYGGATYFGKNTDKNYAWEKGGMNVSFEVKVDAEKLTNGEYTVWTVALNEKDGKYLSEVPVFFIGTNDGVKVIHKNEGVTTDYAALASDANAKKIESGNYKVTYKFTTNKNGEIEVVISVANSENKEVYKSVAETFTVIEPELHEGKNYTNTTVVKEDMVKGLRYLWCARTSVDVEVSKVAITK